MCYFPEVECGGETLAGVPASTGQVCGGESGGEEGLFSELTR